MYKKVHDYKAVKLISPNNSLTYVIIHPSTKEEGLFQLSYFDNDGPIGDITKHSVIELLDILKDNYNTIKELIK